MSRKLIKIQGPITPHRSVLFLS